MALGYDLRNESAIRLTQQLNVLCAHTFNQVGYRVGQAHVIAKVHRVIEGEQVVLGHKLIVLIEEPIRDVSVFTALPVQAWL